MAMPKAREGWQGLRRRDDGIVEAYGTDGAHALHTLPGSDLRALVGMTGTFDGQTAHAGNAALVAHLTAACPCEFSTANVTVARAVERVTQTTATDAHTAATAAHAESDLHRIVTDLLALVARQGAAVDVEQVREIVNGAVADALRHFVPPTPRIDVRINGGDVVSVQGIVHPAFQRVLTYTGCGEHVALIGPAGTGKSTLAAHVAAGLGRRFRFVSGSPAMMPHAVEGFVRPTDGHYHETAFVAAFLAGDVFLFDEFDAVNAGVAVCFNAPVASRIMELPDGRQVTAGDGFIALAALNTWGSGPTAAYVGRNALDAATMSRFARVYVDYDRAYETAMLTGTVGEDAAGQVLAASDRMRSNIADGHLTNVVIGTRELTGIARFAAAGVPWKQAFEDRCGLLALSDEHRTRLLDGVRMPTARVA